MTAHTAYLVGAIIAAGSTLAAWAAVWQVSRIRRRGRMPDLHGQVTKPRGIPYDTLKLTVFNAGGGLAKGVHAAIVGETLAIDPALNTTALLGPGESARVLFQMPVDPFPRVVLVARDVDEFLHAWTLDLQRERVYRGRLRRWKRVYPKTFQIVAEFYPDVPNFLNDREAARSISVPTEEDEQDFYTLLLKEAAGSNTYEPDSPVTD